MSNELKSDLTTKVLLALIALGLLLNAFSGLMNPPVAQAARQLSMSETNDQLKKLAEDLHKVVEGRCRNEKLCP